MDRPVPDPGRCRRRRAAHLRRRHRGTRGGSTGPRVDPGTRGQSRPRRRARPAGTHDRLGQRRLPGDLGEPAGSRASAARPPGRLVAGPVRRHRPARRPLRRHLERRVAPGRHRQRRAAPGLGGARRPPGPHRAPRGDFARGPRPQRPVRGPPPGRGHRGAAGGPRRARLRPGLRGRRGRRHHLRQSGGRPCAGPRAPRPRGRPGGRPGPPRGPRPSDRAGPDGRRHAGDVAGVRRPGRPHRRGVAAHGDRRHQPAREPRCRGHRGQRPGRHRTRRGGGTARGAGLPRRADGPPQPCPVAGPPPGRPAPGVPPPALGRRAVPRPGPFQGRQRLARPRRRRRPASGGGPPARTHGPARRHRRPPRRRRVRGRHRRHAPAHRRPDRRRTHPAGPGPPRRTRRRIDGRHHEHRDQHRPW